MDLRRSDNIMTQMLAGSTILLGKNRHRFLGLLR